MFALERRHLPHLTGFRAIAAYLVLIAHSADITFIYGGSSFALKYVAGLASLGMSIFFVLSGFVITYTYYDRFIQLPWRQAARDFAVARFARLYPLYILLFLFDPHYYKPLLLHGTIAEQISFFTLTQSWWNFQSITFPPAWSISTECFFYLCFALWMLYPRPCATRYSGLYVQRRTIITLTGVFLALSATFFHRANIAAFLSPLDQPSVGVWGWLSYVAPYIRISEFIAGVCAARMFMVTQNNNRLSAKQRRAAVLCVGSGMAILVLLIGRVMVFKWGRFPFFLTQNFGYAPFLAYIFYACSRYPNLLTKWCSTPLMQAGGKISYSIYLLQFMVYSYVLTNPVAVSPSLLAYNVSLLKAILFIVLTTIIALCSYHIIEVPSRRLLRKWL